MATAKQVADAPVHFDALNLPDVLTGYADSVGDTVLFNAPSGMTVLCRKDDEFKEVKVSQIEAVINKDGGGAWFYTVSGKSVVLDDTMLTPTKRLPVVDFDGYVYGVDWIEDADDEDGWTWIEKPDYLSKPKPAKKAVAKKAAKKKAAKAAVEEAP